MKPHPIQTKLKLLLGVLCVSALNLPAFAEYLVADGTAHPAESGITYEAVSNGDEYDSGTAALTVIGTSAADLNGSYTGTNITLSSTFLTPFSGFPRSYGATVSNQGQLTLTSSTITTKGYGGHGVGAESSSTLALTGGTIHTEGDGGYGIYLYGSSSGTVRDANVVTGGSNGYGVIVEGEGSTLTLTGGTITTSGSLGAGIVAFNASSATVSGVSVVTTGENGYGVGAAASSTLTLTDSDIKTTAATALTIIVGSTGTVSLNHNTLTGDITVEASSTLTLTGSNGTVLTGDIIARKDSPILGVEGDGSTINITLTGNGTQLIGNITQDTESAININIENGATLGTATAAHTINGTVTIKENGHITTTLTLSNGITLETGDILDYALNETGLQITTGPLAIGTDIQVDLSRLTAPGDYLILDWTGATGSVSADSFTTAKLNPDMTGTFTVEGTQLTFTAIPEPSTWFLLATGLGLLLLTARYRLHRTHGRALRGEKIHRAGQRTLPSGREYPSLGKGRRRQPVIPAGLFPRP
jgi:autotransporter family porin